MNKLKQIKRPKTYRDLLQWVCCLWAFTIPFENFHGIMFGVFVLMLWGILKGKISVSLGKDKLPAMALALYLLYMISTILWSDDKGMFLAQFEKLIPLIMLTIILFVDGMEQLVDINRIKTAFLWGVLVSIAYMVGYMVYGFFFGSVIGQIKTQGLLSLNLLEHLGHYTYVGITLLMAIPLLFMQMQNQNWKQRISSLLLIGFISLLCIMSGGRTVMVLSILVMIVSFFSVFGKQFKWHWKVGALVAVLSLGTIAILNTQRIQTKLCQLKDGSDIEAVEGRFYIWKSTIRLIKEAPLCGYGLGDVKTELLKVYKKNGFKLALNNKRNAHNQYLQTLASGGSIALLLLLVFFILFFGQKSVKFNALALSFILVYGVALMFESMLVRNAGVFPLVFWVIVINNVPPHPLKLYINKIAMPLILVFSLTILFAFSIPMDTDNPKTWIPGKYEIVLKEDLYSGLDSLTIKRGIYIKTEQIRSNPTDGYYIFHSLLTKRFSSSDSIHVQFNILCNIDSVSSIENIKLRVGNKEAHANMSETGNWQSIYLNCDLPGGTYFFYIYVILNRKTELDTGGVYFAKPSIVVDDKKYL